MMISWYHETNTYISGYVNIHMNHCEAERKRQKTTSLLFEIAFLYFSDANISKKWGTHKYSALQNCKGWSSRESPVNTPRPRNRE